MKRNKNLRRLSVLVTAQTLYNLQRLADMTGSRNVGRVVDKLTREKMLALKGVVPDVAGANVGGADDNVPINEPLTIEELREMDGEPVWIVDVGPHKWYGPGWAIVDRDNCLVRTVKNWNAVFFESYGERWLAYRRPPEGEA